MIEAIAKIGEIELNKLKERGGNELDLLIDKPFKRNEKKKQQVVVLNVDLANNTLILKNTEIEEYPFLNESKYLYKQGSSNGNDFSFTTRYNGDLDKFCKRFQRNVANLSFELSEGFIEKIKSSLNSNNYSLKDNVLVTLKIDGKYLGDINIFIVKFYGNISKTIANIDRKPSKSDNKISYISNEKIAVFGGGMSTSFSFYTIDKPGFAYGLIKTNSVKMLPLSLENTKNLIAGKNCLDADFSHTYAEQRFYLVPIFYYTGNAQLLKAFNRLSKLQNLKSEKEDLADKENKVLAELAKTGDYISFNLLFFKEENSALRILKLIEEVIPSRIKTILEIIAQTNKNLTKHDLTTEYWSEVTFNQKILYHMFAETNSNEKFFEVLDAIFNDKDINYNLLLRRFLKKIRVALHSKGQQKGIYRQTIECFIIYLLFEHLGILKRKNLVMKNNSSKNGGTMMKNKYIQSFEGVFQSYGNIFTKPEIKYLFSLGFLISRVAAKQRENLDSSPILNKLKGLKLRKCDILRLKTSVEGKGREYDISHSILESVDDYFLLINKKINEWDVTDEEVNFFLSLGINMNRCVLEELKKQAEGIPEEIKELEV